MAGTTPVLGSPKTLAGSRTIAIDDSLAEALRLWRVEQRRQRLAAPEWVESDAVVTEPNGERVHPQVLTRRFSALCRSASLPTIRLHDLRHTVASVALASGEDVAVISKCLGHADIAVTLRLYRHVYAVEDEAAAQRLGHLFTGTA